MNTVNRVIKFAGLNSEYLTLLWTCLAGPMIPKQLTGVSFQNTTQFRGRSTPLGTCRKEVVSFAPPFRDQSYHSVSISAAQKSPLKPPLQDRQLLLLHILLRLLQLRRVTFDQKCECCFHFDLSNPNLLSRAPLVSSMIRRILFASQYVGYFFYLDSLSLNMNPQQLVVSKN